MRSTMRIGAMGNMGRMSRVTVRELIEFLDTCNPDAPVMVFAGEPYGYDVLQRDEISVYEDGVHVG
jgi:hypothetical protein